MQNSEIYYKNKVVAFLDILGFRNIVRNNKDNAISIIKKLDEALSHCLKCLEIENGPTWFSVKMFSDCLCLSCEESDLEYMFRELSFMQLYLSRERIFVRGAIGYGPHFENERMIFSEGLINTYDLSLESIYPRILVDNIIVNKILSSDSKYSIDQMSKYLLHSSDDKIFVDYIHWLDDTEGMGLDEIREYFEIHKDAVMNEILSNKSNHNILEKYRWLAEYHNYKFYQTYDQNDYNIEYYDDLVNRLVIPSSIFPSIKKVDVHFFKTGDV